jgi:hypothetical protein
MGRDGSFITGSALLIDGGVIAAITTGRYELRMGWRLEWFDAGRPIGTKRDYPAW